MCATNPLLRVAGVVILLLMGLNARADGLPDPKMAPTPDRGQTDADVQGTMAEAPAPPAKDVSPAVAPASTPVPSAASGTDMETVTERYPNGKTKIECQVAKDAAGNYVKQGTYTEYALDGTVKKTGVFQDGKPQGKWAQSFAKDDGHLFSVGHESEFLGPFTSEATFVDGRLNGTWTIKDCNGQKIVEWNFDQGVRDGKWSWWYPNGDKRLEATFKSGNLDGEVLEWSQDGQLTNKTNYVDGRQLVNTVEWYTLGQKHFEGCYLHVPKMAEPTYDWWKGTITTVAAAPAGENQKHGDWIEWYRGGNKKTEGQYDHNIAVGKFTWWYENGQKRAEVEYQMGVLNGTRTTWHTNGLKESQAAYRNGELVDKWMHWDADGKLVEMRDPSKVAPANAKGNHATTIQAAASAARSR
jgi:antitoxin component YwqK of YwqJK toxin-antitoxin module